MDVEGVNSIHYYIHAEAAEAASSWSLTEEERSIFNPYSGATFLERFCKCTVQGMIVGPGSVSRSHAGQGVDFVCNLVGAGSVAGPVKRILCVVMS